MEFYYRKAKHSKILKKDIRDLLELFDMKVVFQVDGGSCANVESGTAYISINTRYHWTVSNIWSTVFHEVAHVMCFREGLYAKYHDWNHNDRQSRLYMRQYGLRAERFVDNKAKKLMAIYLPDIPFWSGYDTKEGKEWYDAWVRRNFPLPEDQWKKKHN